MADTFKGIITADGKKRQLSYGSILDKPVSDETLSIQGGFADAKVTGDKFKEVNAETSSLKSDITRSKEAIKDLSDKKITKFYASNLGETTLNDSDKGKIQDVTLYGKSFQNGTPTPDNPIDIQSVVNPKIEVCGKNLINPIPANVTTGGVTFISNGDGTYTLNGTNTITWNAYDIFKIKFNKNKTIRLTGGKGCAKIVLFDTKNNVIKAQSFESSPNVTVTLEPYVVYTVSILITDLTTLDNVVLKPMITTDLNATYDDFEPYKGQTASLPYTLNAIPVSSGGNVTIDGQEYIADYVDVERGKLVRIVDSSKLDNTQSIVDKTEWLLADPQEIDFTTEEIAAFKALVTYYPTTNISVNSEQLDGYTVFNYPISMQNGWNYVKQQLNDNRDYIYDMDTQSAEAYVNSEYAVALTELEV